MIRTQINLEDNQYYLLTLEARQQNRSLSDLIRQLLAERLIQKTKKRKGLLALTFLDKSKNKKRERTSVAERHDDYLYGKFSKWEKFGK